MFLLLDPTRLLELPDVLAGLLLFRNLELLDPLLGLLLKVMGCERLE